MRWIIVAWLRLWLLRVLIAGLGLWLLRIIGHLILTWRGIEAVATVGAVVWRRIVVAGGILAVKDTAHHFTHAFAELGQKLDRIFILCLLLLWIAVALRRRRLVRLLIVRRRRRLSVLRLRITARCLRIVALLRLGCR